jgi:hypothetical protein
MAGIKLTNFNGIYPRTAERKLPDIAAQVAENVNLTSGEIRPLRKPKFVRSAVAPRSAYRAVQGGAEKWRTWPIRTNVVRGPLPVDVEARYYWTGEGEPRYAKFSNFETGAVALGVPKPVGAPSVAPVGGSGSSTTRFYCYTFFSADGEESAPSAPSAETVGAMDATWTISNMAVFPANSGTGTASTSVVSGTLQTTFDNGSAAHNLRVGDKVILSGDVVEVARTPTQVEFAVLGDYSAVTSWQREAPWNTTSMTRRVYRTTGTLGDWQLVADNLTATSYVDTLSDALILGDELLTDGWLPPPAKLRGLIVLPSGAACGFVNNLLCFSEPGQIHAWPEAYQLTADHEILGIASYGTVVVAATTSKPHMADGVDPASASFDKVDAVWPCMSGASVTSVGDAVVYATSFGLAMIGLNGSSLMTTPFFTESEWKLYKPATMECAFSENRLFVRWVPVEGESRLLLFKLGEEAPLTSSSVSNEGLYVDPLDGEMYVFKPDGVYRFDADDGVRIPFEWLSKVYELPKPLRLGACRLEFRRSLSLADQAAIEIQRAADVLYNQTTIDTYVGVGGVAGAAINELAINEGPVLREIAELDREYLEFELFANDELIYSNTFDEPASFKLPAGYRFDTFCVRVRGNVRLMTIKLAETMSGLAEV